MRTTLNISFPDDLYLFIRERVDTKGYASISEYIRALVRDDRDKNGIIAKRRRPSEPVPQRVNDLMIGYYGPPDEH
jgi:Arc/MetJ-type ribon-helix-helix transcriptional regulator